MNGGETSGNIGGRALGRVGHIGHILKEHKNVVRSVIFTNSQNVEARGRVVSALDCEAEGRWFESHSGQWLENSLCSPSS